MSVCSPQFLVALLGVSALFFHLPSRASRRAALAVCNLAFLFLFIPNLRSWLLLALFLASGYVTALVLRRRPSPALLAGYLGLLVGAFLILKRYSFLDLMPLGSLLEHGVRIIGLSYMLFRQIHFIVDTMEGQIERPSLWAYLNYQLNLFGLMAGPIQRFQQFDGYWRDPRPLLTDRHELLRSYLRIGLGVLKIAVVASFCLQLYEAHAGALDPATSSEVLSRSSRALRFLALFYLYPAYIYFNFSGYCDIVIGGASLVGLPMPENFMRPFLARNMIDYWTRWHRTLGLWVRDYLFIPLYRSTARWPGRDRPLKPWSWTMAIPTTRRSLAFLCYFVALFITGVWHGTTANFVIFGLLNGVGVAAAKLWEDSIVRRGGHRALREYLGSGRVRLVAVTANLHFVCLTIYFFPTDLARSLRILRSLAESVT